MQASSKKTLNNHHNLLTSLQQTPREQFSLEISKKGKKYKLSEENGASSKTTRFKKRISFTNKTGCKKVSKESTKTGLRKQDKLHIKHTRKPKNENQLKKKKKTLVKFETKRSPKLKTQNSIPIK